MGQALILDSEAVHALARARERGALAVRARAILTRAHELRALVRVPAPVLAEVCRSSHLDAAVARLLTNHGIVVTDLTRRLATRAGGLLAKAGMSSEHAVDAFVVSTALDFTTAVIAASDPKGIARLAAPFQHVRVFAI